MGLEALQPPKLIVSPKTEFANFVLPEIVSHKITDISVGLRKCTKKHYSHKMPHKFSGYGAQPPPHSPLPLGRGTPALQTLLAIGTYSTSTPDAFGSWSRHLGGLSPSPNSKNPG